MENLIFDSHAHYDDHAFDEDRDVVLSGLKENGVGYVVDICAAMDDMEKILKLTRKYDFMYSAAGLHPSELVELNDENLSAIREMLADPKCRAVGEIGLDYHYDLSPRDAQREVFDRQMDMAFDLGVPVQLHIREAHGDCLDMLRARAKARRMPAGIMHCFGYSKEMARQFLDLGYYIALGGVVTFKNARRPVEVVQTVPLEHLFVETDSPYMAPVPFRGQTNTPVHVEEVAKKFAQIKDLTLEEVAETTFRNACGFYGITY